ncbi:hypothetical protein HNR44_001384 [Geomicrobium halophilum]|uniref:Uncharacterized protein n=1 Tax=Geomicrobium halophilum TaxID=549000 RepID=A0A841PYU3_9BACL|nr:DUF5325 family protein [Geomicrobium halophilum]MBB6449435.1 hypothetical protein [Geomicrobium halophilum]
MRNVDWTLLSLAFLATVAIASYGIAVAERSFLIAIIATVVLILSFRGAAIYRKKKLVTDND